MIKSQEHEFIAVRVQDPRVQNEGSWNSYMDFKIFLHTNSKAFTAKTSCVRRRYSEFVWLKKKLQKNAGLVPVPNLPQKSYFTFKSDDFIERRRKGLQSFLDRVLHMTVCLSDSQLHLFLQTQLPVKHIEDCVQGHTPYTVTEAILTYASSNRGWVQEEGVGSPELWPTPVPYESVESPAPHMPSLQCAEAASGALPNEHTDVIDVETLSELSNTEQTAPELKWGSDQEQMLKEEECTVSVKVHPNISYLTFVETKLEGEDRGYEETQKLEKKYQVAHIDSPLEVKPLQDVVDGADKAFQEMCVEETEEKNGFHEAVLEKQYNVRQTSLTKDIPDQDVQVHLDHNAENIDHKGTDTICESHEAITSVENIPAMENTIRENGISDENSSIDTAIQNDAVDEKSYTHLEISETCFSPTDSNEDNVDEVNMINAKSVHTGSAILILEGTEEALGMTKISCEDANSVDVNTLVLKAIEIDSVDCQERKCCMIITPQEPESN